MNLDFYINQVEKGNIPDFLVKFGIRKLCSERLKWAKQQGLDGIKRHNLEWVDRLKVSKVLSENLLSFGPEFSFLNEMSIINETAKDSCDSALKYSNDEMEIRSQKAPISLENKGIFEKLFNYFTEK